MKPHRSNASSTGQQQPEEAAAPADLENTSEKNSEKALKKAAAKSSDATASAKATERRRVERRRANRRDASATVPARPPGVEEVMVIREPKSIGFDQYTPGPIPPHEVRGVTLYSGVSAGTEMTIFRGSNVYARKRWDTSLKLFLPEAAEKPFYPAVVGYEEVGCVTQVGADVKGVEVGDCVWGSWGHRTEWVMRGDHAAANILPAGLDPRAGIFARIGAIALNGVLDAGINVGETVAVYGAGVVGLICMALAQLSGARVYAVDINPARLHHAERYADEVISQDAALTIKKWTGGRGADVVIEATGNTFALGEAIRSVAYAGKVVSLGFYQGSAQGLFLGEEFHHNRVQVICSQIFNVPPALSFRWDVSRLERTIMALQATKRLDLIPLITQEIPFRQAASAYTLLEDYPDSALQIALTFPDALCKAERRRSTTSPAS
jgi:2-desacetyl-2-hydroxyethyl bacteriochlorophyllide A dehydrogenase